MAEKASTNPYHPDVTLFLVLIPFISAINYYLTYSNIHFNGFLLLTFTIDTTQGYLAWWAVRRFILYLDRRLPYDQNLSRRILVQIPGTLVLGLLIISSTTELVSWMAKGKAAPLNFYSIDLIIIGIWFFVINGIYFGLYYYNEWKKTEQWRAEESRVKTGGIMVTQGKQDLLIRFEDLAGCFVDSDYVVVCSTTGQKYYLVQSLDKVAQQLPTTHFFRLNRQYMVHRQLISGFKRAENGKILVLLHANENFPAEIPVSRTKAVSFKQWFRPE